MTDVQVTDADRKAATAAWKAAKENEEHGLAVLSLAEHFAAHAARAVQAERKRCVEIVTLYAKDAHAEADKNDTTHAGLRCRAIGDAMSDVAKMLADDQLEKGAG